MNNIEDIKTLCWSLALQKFCTCEECLKERNLNLILYARDFSDSVVKELGVFSRYEENGYKPFDYVLGLSKTALTFWIISFVEIMRENEFINFSDDASINAGLVSNGRLELISAVSVGEL